MDCLISVVLTVKLKHCLACIIQDLVKTETSSKCPSLSHPESDHCHSGLLKSTRLLSFYKIANTAGRGDKHL